jgi:hypothetical protein
MVVFACACGKQMQAKVQYAGRSVRCPACGTAVTVPGGEAEVVALQAEPPRARLAPPPLADDYDDAPRARRQRPPARRSSWPLILGLSLALLVIIGGVGAFLLFMRGGDGPDLAYVPGDAQGIASLRVADVWNSQSTKDALKALPNGMTAENVSAMMKTFVGIEPGDVERVTGVLVDAEKGVGWGIVSLTKAVDEKDLLGKLAPMIGAGQERTHNNKKYKLFKGELAIHFASSRLVIVGPEKGVQACLDQKGGKPTGVVERGLNAIKGKHHVVVAFAVPAKATEEMRKAMSANREAAPFAALAELQGIIYQGDVASKSDVEITLVFDSDDKAAKGKDALVKAKEFAVKQLQLLRQQPGANLGQAAAAFDQMESTLGAITIDQSGKDVVARAKIDNTLTPVAAGLLLPAVQKVREAAARSAGANNLHQLALAMQTYHDNHGHFPPPIKYGPTGQPLWSWRVELLPYLDHDNMYKQLNPVEPWNGPNNSKVLAQMPKVFQSPQTGEADRTHYQLFVGPGAAFSADRNVGPPRLTDIKDGTSNTIMITEAMQAVPWAAPQDLRVDFGPGKPQFFQNANFTLGVQFNQPFHVAMFDGSVRQINRSVTPQHLAWAIMPADGQVLPPGWEGK